MTLATRLKKAFNAFMESDAPESKRTTETPRTDITLELKKAKDLQHISLWITDVARQTQDMCQKNKLPKKGRSFVNATGIDMEQFDRQDLEKLKTSLKYLHAVCQNANIAVEIEGFDLLPRPAYANIFNGGAYDIQAAKEDNFLGHLPALHIFINTKRPYNYKTNPYSTTAIGGLRQKHNLPPLKQ